MAKKAITVIVCRLGEEPKVEQMEHSLYAMQALVGGYIECVRLQGTPYEHGIDLWCDEEFLLKDYAPNRMVRADLVIHGNFFIAAHDDEGETISLTPNEQLAWLPRVAGWPQPIPLS